MKDLQGKIVGIAIDGAKFLQEHVYAIIFINSAIIRLYDIVKIDNQKSETIAAELHKCYLECTSHNITVSGIGSDNAAALICAIEGKHPFNLPNLLGESIIMLGALQLLHN